MIPLWVLFAMLVDWFEMEDGEGSLAGRGLRLSDFENENAKRYDCDCLPESSPPRPFRSAFLLLNVGLCGVVDLFEA